MLVAAMLMKVDFVLEIARKDRQFFDDLVNAPRQLVFLFYVARDSRFTPPREVQENLQTQSCLGALYSPVNQVHARRLMLVEDIRRILLERLVERVRITEQNAGAEA